jgi:hypothetical protein
VKPLSSIALAAGLIAPALLAGAARADQPAAQPPQAGQPARAGDAKGPASQSTGPAGPDAKPAEDPRDRKIRELEQIIADLAKRVSELERHPAAPAGSVQLKQPNPQPPAPVPPPGEPMPVPPPGEPGPQPVPPGEGPQPVPPGEVPAGPAGASATLIPNLSVIGRVEFRAGVKPIVENRGHLGMAELEIALQDAVAPAMRYDIFLTAERDDEFRLGIEEAYMTASRLGPGLTGRAGIMRVPFGRFNPTHAHTWFFITEPSVIRAFLGPDGLRADGGVLEKQFHIPLKDVFARAELGGWRTTSETEDRYGFTGGKGGAASGRLWFGKAITKDKDIEVGFSRFQGRGPVNGFGRKMLAIDGMDVVYRSYPSAEKRIWLQGEALVHETWLNDDSLKARFGMFFFGAYKWSQFWEFGGRFDWTQYPFGFSGSETAGSLWLTKFITEQTSLRVQYTHAVSPEVHSNDEFFLQLLFGSGPHSHNIQ